MAPSPDGSPDGRFDRYCRELLELSGEGEESPNIVILRRVDSTQRLSRRYAREFLDAEENVPEATLVAYEQTTGRGRRGRSWKSPPGHGAYVTLVRILPRNELLSRLPLLVGVALARTVNGWVEGECRLKWPNDLQVGGRKIGGILIDAISRPGEGAVAFVGFGVNRGRKGSDPPHPGSTTVTRETSEAPSLARLTHGLISALEEIWPRLEDAEWLVARYREVTAHRPGERLACRLGEASVEGAFRGFDPQGRLLLETANGVESLASGELITTPKGRA